MFWVNRSHDSGCEIGVRNDRMLVIAMLIAILRVVRLQNKIGTNFLLEAQNFHTVGTKMIADPEKCFQELLSEKLQISFAGWALFGINYLFQ